MTITTGNGNQYPIIRTGKSHRIDSALKIECMACAMRLATFRDTLREGVLTMHLCLCPICHRKPADEVLKMVARRESETNDIASSVKNPANRWGRQRMGVLIVPDAFMVASPERGKPLAGGAAPGASGGGEGYVSG